MSIIDKANEYIGHPREVDEGYEVSMRRTAYAQGYQDAIEKACECLIKLHNWPTQYEEYATLQEEFIKEFRKVMEE